MFENTRGKKLSAQGATISIDPLSENILFCTMSGDQSALVTQASKYSPRSFDETFYSQLSSLLQQQKAANPDMDLQRAALILPDQLFLLDMVNIPIIHRKAMQQSLSLAIEALYKNAPELSLLTYPVQQSKQTATFGLAGARRDLLEKVRKVFAENGIAVTGVTFAANAMVNGAFAANPKLRGETFLLLDIKPNYARYAFVVRGRTMGYFDLPFGYKALSYSRVMTESKLFDHRSGELLVLNAKERAKAKQLTEIGGFGAGQNDEMLDDETAGDGLVQKSGHKLPKFMQRPVPETNLDFIYENFRIFMKWTLELISNNPDIVSLAKLDKVYVNMPRGYSFLFDRVNHSKDQHGVTFLPLLTEEDETGVAENLEMCGGFFLGQFNEANTF